MGSSFDKNDLLKNRGYKWWSGEVEKSLLICRCWGTKLRFRII